MTDSRTVSDTVRLLFLMAFSSTVLRFAGSHFDFAGRRSRVHFEQIGHHLADIFGLNSSGISRDSVCGC
jgi:hypothetical protein